MSSYIVQSGDVLLIPADAASTMTPLEVKWKQNLSDKQASYNTSLVNVKDKREFQLFYRIQA